MSIAERTHETRTKKSATMRLSSSAFEDGQRMPARHTGDGPDLSPPLSWSHPPAETRSLALMCEDVDSSFVHWLVWNISPDALELPEGVSSTSSDEGFSQGQNGLGTYGYVGPNLGPGTHAECVFRLYALDTRLQLAPGATRGDLDEAMEGHVIAEAALKGRYGSEA
jgi:Raf kinase inhibitor-like YbhB/YbcL family protein